mmetsp:Transcript_11780/g.14840  ORF Transcript_11780/g.14840 Transcript_11780/m.14840 type:complete len:112 (+) Transcript_11780:809-1144(+)
MSHTRRAVEDGWSLPTRRLNAVEAAVDADILVLLSLLLLQLFLPPTKLPELLIQAVPQCTFSVPRYDEEKMNPSTQGNKINVKSKNVSTIVILTRLAGVDDDDDDDDLCRR